jgi:hypothetical protein
MIKRSFMFILLALSIVLMYPLAAQADIILEPRNDFYGQHSSECIYLGRSYYANGPGGSVSVKEAPGMKKEVAVIENSEKILIQYTYNHSGQDWGTVFLGGWDNGNQDGWIPMEQLLLVYDFMSFDEEHQDEYYPYSGDYEELFAPGDMVLWAWPGSGVVEWILEEEWRDAELDRNFLKDSRAYKDSAGREWVYTGYMYGARNTWACLSDPFSTDITAFNPQPPPPELWQPGDAGTHPSGLSLPVLIIILVAVLVAGTAVLIRVFWKKK